jgi:hypothetical protein
VSAKQSSGSASSMSSDGCRVEGGAAEQTFGASAAVTRVEASAVLMLATPGERECGGVITALIVAGRWRSTRGAVVSVDFGEECEWRDVIFPVGVVGDKVGFSPGRWVSSSDEITIGES